MKIPYNWLKDYVDVNISAKELADKLTLSGSQAEEVIMFGDTIQNVVTCKFIKIEKHPDAEKLKVCQVDIGKEELLQIVTAADNMKEGDIVPVALHGSVLADGTKIKKGKLRGIVSNGMFCSEEELGILVDEPVHGLMILDKDTEIGVDIKEALKLNKAVIDFEITSNRPDCLCMFGMARETSATLNIPKKMPNMNFKVNNDTNINDQIKVTVNDKLCKRYMARMVKNVKVMPSPQWMQEKLQDAGVRPINNVVDVTNYVMLELGQPLHAFDKREIKSQNIVVEKAEGNKFTTLDGTEREISEDVLCIKDSKEIIALAGIMGGLDSGVKDDTTEFILESANFEGTNIRVNSKKLGIRTESSLRFEKEIDPNLCELAINRACALIEELNIGEVCMGTIDVYNDVKEEFKMTVSSNYINRFLGTDLTIDVMKSCLDRLDLLTEINEDDLVISVPTFRIDINIKQDIAEEIARIYGYDKIKPTIITTSTEKEPKSQKQKLDHKVIETMISSGLNQSISYSFVSPKVFSMVNLKEDSTLRNAVKIKNPLGEDYSIMRTTTIPSMMECLARNYSRNIEEARLFELGKIYIPNEDEKSLPTEKNILTIGLYGNVDYLDIKGVVENLLDSLSVKKFTFVRESENNSYHPGKTANVVISKKISITLGEVHPDVTENYGIDTSVYLAEIDLDSLYEAADVTKKYSPLPKFPAVTRDIALLVDDVILVQEIEDTIRKAGGNLVESVKLFDVYKGSQIPDGKKSIAYAISYRDPNKTLTDKEVNKVHDKILRALEYKLSAQLR